MDLWVCIHIICIIVLVLVLVIVTLIDPRGGAAGAPRALRHGRPGDPYLGERDSAVMVAAAAFVEVSPFTACRQGHRCSYHLP